MVEKEEGREVFIVALKLAMVTLGECGLSNKFSLLSCPLGGKAQEAHGGVLPAPVWRTSLWCKG